MKYMYHSHLFSSHITSFIVPDMVMVVKSPNQPQHYFYIVQVISKIMVTEYIMSLILTIRMGHIIHVRSWSLTLMYNVFNINDNNGAHHTCNIMVI